MIVSIPYHPSKPQRLFHETEADEVGYGGDIGGGKTKALVMDALLVGLRFPGITMYMFRATYQQGADTLLEEIERSYPKEIARYNKQDTTVYYAGGSKLKIRQCNSLADAMKNDGKEFGKLYIDEAQHQRFDAFDYLCTRPRANKELGVKPQVKFTAMQGGKGHSWIKRNFAFLEANEPTPTVVHDIKTKEEYTIYRQFIPASLSDNKHVDDKYAGRLAMRSERLQKKTRNNDWNAIEGQSFPEWVDKPTEDGKPDGKPTDKWTHVVKAFEIPAHWPIYRGFDYGRSSPYSVLWFTKADETYNGRLFLIHELYGGKEDETGLDETASQIAEKIAAFERPLVEKHGWIEGVADPSIFGKSKFSDETVASVMEQHGVVFLNPHYDYEAAFNVINNRLQGKELIHEALLFDAEGYPGFQVFDRCKKFRQHFPELTADPKNPDDVDTDGADHDYDACRYVIVLTKPKIKAPVELSKRRRMDPLNFGERRYEGNDTGRMITLPDIKIGV